MRRASWAGVLARALERDPERRYASVEALAEDLRRFRDHEPLRAGPPSRLYALRKLVRRHRGAVAAGFAVVAALAAGLARSELNRARAVEARADALLESRRHTALHDFVLGMVLNAGGPDATILDLLRSGRTRLDTVLADDPRVRASAQATLAKAFLNVDRVEPARELLEDALAWEREHGAPGSETWVQAHLDWMALLLRERRCAEGLELCERLLPWTADDASRGAATHANLLARRGVMRQCLGELPAARASFEAALAVYREHGLEALPDYWDTQESLAACQAELGDLEGALASKRRVAAGREALLGPEDALVATSLSALGTAYTDLGRWAEGLPYLERGLEVLTRTQGREHWGRAMALNNLACALMQLGRLDEARARFAECIELADGYRGSELAVGEAREAGLLACVNLGFLERHVGRSDAAVARFQHALEEYADRGASPGRRAAQTALAKEYEKLGLDAEAAELARAACASHDRVPGAVTRLADLELAVRTSLAAGAVAPLEPLLDAELDRRAAAGADPAPVRALLARVEAAAPNPRR